MNPIETLINQIQKLEHELAGFRDDLSVFSRNERMNAISIGMVNLDIKCHEQQIERLRAIIQWRRIRGLYHEN